MKNRRGISLVEMLAVITIGTLLTAITVGLLHTLLQTGHAARDQLHQRATLRRLADTFRRDVHAAVAFHPVERNAEPHRPAWQLTLRGDDRVEYRLEQGELVRNARTGDTVRTRESFMLPPETTVSMRLQPGGRSDIVVLLMVPGARIEAALGTDHRFTH
jgi:type II secretory pathway pseudopilin PulG